MSPKEESKTGDATVTVNVDDFTRTRDSVIVSLAQLQSAVSDLSRAYINHANTVLNRGSPNIDISGLTGGITSTLVESGLLGRLASPGVKSEAGDKKKKKRAHDPNAPKRALTPYFLFMQSNRSRIAAELGPNASAAEVNEEGLRRWTNMQDSEKENWRKLYQENFAIYRKKMEAYKAGLPTTDVEHAEDSKQHDSGARDVSDEESSSESEEEEEEEASPEPVKEPSPPPRKRRRSESKSTKEPAASKEAPAPSPAKKEASPEKKRRTAPKKDKEAPKEKENSDKEQEPASARKETNGEQKRTKKKRKSEAGGEG